MDHFGSVKWSLDLSQVNLSFPGTEFRAASELGFKRVFVNESMESNNNPSSLFFFLFKLIVLDSIQTFHFFFKLFFMFFLFFLRVFLRSEIMKALGLRFCSGQAA